MLPFGLITYRVVQKLTRRGATLPPNQPNRPAGPLVWCHLQSDDDLPAITALVTQMQQERDDVCFLITCASGAIDAAKLPDMFITSDLPDPTVNGAHDFLSHWAPDLVMWMDRDLRINLLLEVEARKIPAIWVNARTPKPTMKTLRWAPGSLRHITAIFDTILAENDQCYHGLRRLLLPRHDLRIAGALQEQATSPKFNQAEREDLASLIGARPVWFAQNLPQSEENAVLAAHRQAMRKSHRLLLILSPADCQRASELTQSLEAEGWIVATRSLDQDPESEVQIYIADIGDEDGLWMHLSPTCFYGHTLDGGECDHPYDAAALGSVVLFGPNAQIHTESFDRLDAAGAAKKVTDTCELAGAVEHLLSPDNSAKMAMAAWEITTSGAEVTALVQDLLIEKLDAQGV